MIRNVSARSVFLYHSPALGARVPPIRNVAFAPSSFTRRSVSAAHCSAMIGLTGNPCSARRIAGLSASASEIVPYFSSSAAQPESAPGTVTGSAPKRGTRRCPRLISSSRVMSEPERPEALRPTRRFSRADHRMANMSPPIPVMWGSTRLSTAAAVTAASMALPPFWSTASPAEVARGWLVAMAALGA